MKKKSKRFRADAAKVDPNRKVEIPEAVKILKSFTPTKFDSAVEVSIKLNVDPKKSEQNIRGSLALPKGIGKQRRVIVFADGEEARAAQEMGADEVGMEELAKKIEGGWFDFDVAIAMPRTMKVISKLGKVLGPKGLMPSPKNGTVTEDVRTAVREFKAGKIEFRNDANGNVHAAVGKLSFSEADLNANVEAFIEHIKSLRPTTVKGQYIENVSVSATMSPGIPVAVQG
ncbi:MAG: 50S ribosomal protein L1 [Planctomycetes bacterium]|nr:50S ribosomal protein L1 [Planctomycetota bacterium]